MIVKMKKVTLLLRAKHRDESLKKLRQLGVLHIQDINAPLADDIQSLENKIDNLNRALTLIAEETAEQKRVRPEQVEEYIDNIIELSKQKDDAQREMNELLEMNAWYERWGDISAQSVHALKNAGIYVRLYIADKQALKKIDKDKLIHIEREDQGTVYFALLAQSAEERLDFKEELIPPIEPVDVRLKMDELKNKITDINSEFSRLAQYRENIVEYRQNLQKSLDLNRVKYGMGEDGELAYLQGFCPVDTVDDLKKMADHEGWGYIGDEPDDPNEVPTLTRNPKWLRMIRPLFEFMGTLPGYHELDVSFVFLAFFSVFFAILVGDGGYGLVFLILTFIMGRKKKSGSREFIHLMYVLSLTTILWGLISGNWFGSKTLAQLPFLKIFVIPQLDTFSDVSTGFVMQLSFVIGVLQLSIGHLLAAFQKINSPRALSDVGWVIVLWAVFFVANALVLSKPMPDFTLTLLAIGVGIIVIFANFQKNLIKGMLQTIGNLPLDVISSFSDIVSYIRLFAVGFASFIVASSFNEMAIGAGIDNVFSGIIAAIVLFLGHALNIALCGMAVLVHGVRLNMLEFSGHVGVQWTGKPYKPFKE